MLTEWRYEAVDAKIKCGNHHLGLSCRKALPYSVTKNQDEMAKTCTNKVFLEKARNSREFQPFSELTFKFRVVTIKFPTEIFSSDRITPHSLENVSIFGKRVEMMGVCPSRSKHIAKSNLLPAPRSADKESRTQHSETEPRSDIQASIRRMALGRQPLGREKFKLAHHASDSTSGIPVYHTTKRTKKIHKYLHTQPLCVSGGGGYPRMSQKAKSTMEGISILGHIKTSHCVLKRRV